jgi:hypothetical protein
MAKLEKKIVADAQRVPFRKGDVVCLARVPDVKTFAYAYALAPDCRREHAKCYIGRGSELSKLIIRKKALLKNVRILKSNYYTDGLRNESESEDSTEDSSEDSSDESIGFPNKRHHLMTLQDTHTFQYPVRYLLQQASRKCE